MDANTVLNFATANASTIATVVNIVLLAVHHFFPNLGKTISATTQPAPVPPTQTTPAK